MRILIREMVGLEICAGAIFGRSLLGKLLAASANEPKQSEILFIDFKNIEVATASFLRESIIAFRNIIRGRRSKFYPVVANANASVTEELEDVLLLKKDVLIICKTSSIGDVSHYNLIGYLDPKQHKIFNIIETRGSIDAARLQAEFGSNEGIKQTAWNNRLSSLSQAGIVIEEIEGRSKNYKSLFEGVSNGR